MGNHFEREAKLMLILPGLHVLVTICATVLFSHNWYGSFDEKTAQNQLLSSYPGCRVVSWAVGDGDSEHVYVSVSLECTDHSFQKHGELLFRRVQGEWVLSWKKLE